MCGGTHLKQPRQIAPSAAEPVRSVRAQFGSVTSRPQHRYAEERVNSWERTQTPCRGTSCFIINSRALQRTFRGLFFFHINPREGKKNPKKEDASFPSRHPPERVSRASGLVPPVADSPLSAGTPEQLPACGARCRAVEAKGHACNPACGWCKGEEKHPQTRLRGGKAAPRPLRWLQRPARAPGPVGSAWQGPIPAPHLRDAPRCCGGQDQLAPR